MIKACCLVLLTQTDCYVKYGTDLLIDELSKYAKYPCTKNAASYRVFMDCVMLQVSTQTWNTASEFLS